MYIEPGPMLTLLALILVYLLGVQVGRWDVLRGPMRKWCVFDPEAPDVNQTIVEARSSTDALAIAAREVFGLDVEEAE